MGLEFPTMEDECELSLELSIGGCYAKSEPRSLEEGERAAPSEGILEIPRSDPSGAAESGGEVSDLRRWREMQALKRKEARLKMEFKKSRALPEAHGGGERREREGAAEEESPAPKRERNSTFGENKVSWQQQLLFPVGNGSAPWVLPFWGSNVVAGEREETPENAAPPPPSWSASSHGRNTSRKEGSSSDTAGSHSSSFGTNHSQKLEHVEVQTEPTWCIGSTSRDHCTKAASSSTPQEQQRQPEMSRPVEGSTTHARSSLTDTTCSTTEKLSPSPTSSVINTPPNLPSPSQDGRGLAQQMPCVSTTGNGPNGRTITGFLHKYTKSEVSIMCVCHGSFFSPAGFVEHAGGVDITHPLRHITVVPPVGR